jgi:integrase
LAGNLAGIGIMRLPKYVREKSGTYHYQRDYPTNLRHLFDRKTFTYPLKLSANNATEMQLNKKAIEAEEAFERQKLLISNSDPDALSATDLEKAAADYLRRLKLKPAQYVKVKQDIHTKAKEDELGQKLQDDNTDYADLAIPEFEEIQQKDAQGLKLTAKEKVIGHAYMKLINKELAKPQTLGSIWKEYKLYRGIDSKSRVGKKAEGYWQRWISIAGDVPISPNTLEHINQGLDAYVAEREGKVTSQSIRRELSDVLACLRYASKRHRLNWYIELPFIKETKPNVRHPLEQHEQIELVKAILGNNGSINPTYGSALLLCLQGGMMVSEIERLRPDDVNLDADIPYIRISNETKTQERKRIVPIVLGLEHLKSHLENTIKWLIRSTESTPSATLKKIMRKVTGNESTSAHCLRHTFRINAQDAGVDVLSIASIAGWSDANRKMSDHLLNYGSAGVSQSNIVKKLYEDSVRIHQHLIDIEMENKTNVIPLRGR